MDRRIVVTGYGAICALGDNKIDIKKSFFEAKNNMKYISSIKDYGELNHVKVGLTLLQNYPVVTPEDMDKSERLARVAINEALTDAGITKDYFDELGGRISLSISTSIMGSDYILKFIEENREDAKWLVQSKAFACRLVREFKIHGGCYTTSSACASGTAGLGIAYDLIKENKADIVLTGGTDHISDISIYGFKALDTLSEDICKPFDKTRDGINVGEGSAFFIIEEYGHAISRNAKIYGEVLGYGLANDAYHITSPDPTGNGAYHSMKMALNEAKIESGSKIYINAHGTGTQANDAMELNAIKNLFDENQIYMSSTKSLTGHCLGAAGSIEMALALMVLNDGRAPRTFNSKFDMEGINNISDDIPESVKINTILSNSFAFGGNDATVIVGRI